MGKIFYTAEEYSKAFNVSKDKAYEIAKSPDFSTFDVAYQSHKLIYKKSDLNNAYVIALMNQKGGCGKTSSSVHLATFLAMNHFKVLLIDTDPQNQCQMFFKEDQYPNTLREVLSKEIDARHAIYTKYTKQAEVHFMPSSDSLGTFLYQSNYQNENGIGEAIEHIKKDFDFIIIDTSPYFGLLNVSVSKASNSIVIPATPTTLHIQAMMKTFEDLELVAKVNRSKFLGVLPTIVNLKEKEQEINMENLSSHDDYNKLLFKTYIPESTYVKRLALFSTNLFDDAPNSSPSKSYKRFVYELLQRI